MAVVELPSDAGTLVSDPTIIRIIVPNQYVYYIYVNIAFQENQPGRRKKSNFDGFFGHR